MPDPDTTATGPATSLERAAWRVARAPRTHLLLDGAGYFGTLREVMKNARRRIVIVGWDIDSRAPLAADPAKLDDGLPLELGPFLAALAARRPDIEIKLLLWDYSVLYALEREPLPRWHLDWTSPPQIMLCMDGTLPIGASHHQKLVVVDDAIAFCGGLDLTIRRWDTPKHDPGDVRRVDPKGIAYPPFHDLQMMVDGEAAVALAELVRERWVVASGVMLEPVTADSDPWPAALEPDFREVDLAIARTRPAQDGIGERREGEATLRAAIAEAERFVYIENQYLTADAFAEAMIARMRELPCLEVLAVVPAEHEGWLEKNAMQAGRARLVARFRNAGLADRLRLVTPVVEAEGRTAHVAVHAKVMVVDDRSLRVGSSNLNNRSMGLDTECDITLLARDGAQCDAVARFRNSLIAEHSGASIDEIAEAMAGPEPVLASLDRFAGGARRLEPVLDDPAIGNAMPEPVATFADPDRPWPEAISIEALREPRSARRWLRRWPIVAAVLALFGLVLLWRVSPLQEWTEIDRLVEPMRAVAASRWAFPATVAVFLAGSLALFPVTVLVAVTAMVFGPWEGIVYSLAGALAAALVGFGIGRLAGQRAPSVWKVRDGRVSRLTQAFTRNGVIGIASLRMLPVAPFTIINVAAGATRVRIADYLIGSALGLCPGIIAFNLMGVQLVQVVTNGGPQDIAILVGLLVGWLLVSVLLQRLINRYSGSLRERSD